MWGIGSSNIKHDHLSPHFIIMNIDRIYKEIKTLDLSKIKGRPARMSSNMTTLEIMAYLEWLSKHEKETLIRFANKYPTLGCINVKAFL